MKSDAQLGTSMKTYLQSPNLICKVAYLFQGRQAFGVPKSSPPIVNNHAFLGDSFRLHLSSDLRMDVPRVGCLFDNGDVEFLFHSPNQYPERIFPRLTTIEG